MAVGLGTVVDSINLFLKYMFSGNLQAGEMGKAPGQVFSAQGWYYNADGVRCDMSIDISSSPDVNGAYAIFTAPDYVVYTNPSVADMSTFNITYYSGIAQLQTGQNFDWAVTYPGAWSQDYDILTFAMDVDSGQSNWRITAENGGLPIVGAGGFTGMKLNNSAPVVTNNQTFINDARYYYNDWQIIDLTDIEYNQHYTYNEIMNIIIPAIQVYYPEVSATDFISESEIISSETETETGGNGCNCDCTTIYVNADGSLTLNNDISGDVPINIDNNADLSLSVNAAAGAFGAGAIVVDPNANINLNAGAFAAGAFGAGAIVSPDVSVSGNVDIGDISGEINVNASEITVSGGDINIDQSGATNNNTYNNYYYGTTEPVEPEQPFTIDYGEILSEGELQSILNQETYNIVISTDSDDVISLPDTIPDDVNELILLPSDVVSASSAVVGYGSQIISDLGLTPIYAPLALFSCFCWMIRGGK